MLRCIKFKYFFKDENNVNKLKDKLEDDCKKSKEKVIVI